MSNTKKNKKGLGACLLDDMDCWSSRCRIFHPVDKGGLRCLPFCPWAPVLDALVTFTYIDPISHFALLLLLQIVLVANDKLALALARWRADARLAPPSRADEARVPPR